QQPRFALLRLCTTPRNYRRSQRGVRLRRSRPLAASAFRPVFHSAGITAIQRCELPRTNGSPPIRTCGTPWANTSRTHAVSDEYPVRCRCHELTLIRAPAIFPACHRTSHIPEISAGHYPPPVDFYFGEPSPFIGSRCKVYPPLS